MYPMPAPGVSARLPVSGPRIGDWNLMTFDGRCLVAADS